MKSFHLHAYVAGKQINRWTFQQESDGMYTATRGDGHPPIVFDDQDHMMAYYRKMLSYRTKWGTRRFYRGYGPVVQGPVMPPVTA